jgi:peptidoglycan hydrolase CwlO-like protein
MNKTTSMNGALILIAVALAGAGVSYHFTLQSRFAAIEQKLDQNSVALQQYQAAQETLATSKLDTLNNLSKEIDTLQASLTPLGQATHEQTDSLAEMHKEIATLQQSQQAQQDAAKKLADYATQLDKMKRDIQAAQLAAPASAPSAPVTTVTPAPSALPAIAPHASLSPTLMLPVPPRAESAVDIRPDQSTAVAEDGSSVRALPVALPVADAR